MFVSQRMCAFVYTEGLDVLDQLNWMDYYVFMLIRWNLKSLLGIKYYAPRHSTGNSTSTIKNSSSKSSASIQIPKHQYYFNNIQMIHFSTIKKPLDES